MKCLRLFALSLIGFAAATATAEARPSRTDILITDVTVADVEQRRFIPSQVIAISNGRIIYVGSRSAEWSDVERVIDGRQLIALPGFINTHTHLWQHVARGVEPAGRLQEWAPAVYAFAHHFQPGEVHDVTRAAAAQALLNGITTVADFASVNFTESATAETVAALTESRIGGAVIWWRPPVFLPWQLQDRQLAELRRQGGSQLSIWVGFGPLSFMPIPMVYDGIMTARRNGLRMSEHAMENLAEARDFDARVRAYLQNTTLSEADRELLESALRQRPPTRSDALIAMSRLRDDIFRDPARLSELEPSERQALASLPSFELPSQLQLLEAWGALDQFLAIHSVWPTRSEIALYHARGAGVSHNPESNMYLSSGVAPLQDYIESGVPVALGTDGAASNDRISMFDAMRIAWLLQKVATLHPDTTRRLDGWSFLRMATLEGATVLGLADRTGSIREGKEADLMLLNRDRMGLAPSSTAALATTLVTSADARDIDYVIADGRIMAERGMLVGQDEQQLALRLSAISEQLRQREIGGKSWQERFSLQSAHAAFFRYRLIKRADEVDVEIFNRTDGPITFTVAFAGTVFGGRSPLTMHPQSLIRYPAAPARQFDSYQVRLNAGGSLRIRKERGETSYRLRHANRNIERQMMAAEQIGIFRTN